MTQHKAYAQGTTVVLVGTKRGLFTLTSKDRENWDIKGPALRGHRVYHAILDARNAWAPGKVRGLPFIAASATK